MTRRDVRRPARVAFPFVAPVALAALVAGAGCLSERPYLDPAQNAGDGAAGAQDALSLAGGVLKGDFGPRKGFDGPSTTLEGASDPQWKTSTVTVARADQIRGTGMVILWTNGFLLEELAPGRHDYTYDASALDAPAVTMNVCSGTDASSIDYDTPADHVTATVTPTSTGRTVALHTETHVVDPATGAATGAVQTSDTTFALTSR